MNRAALLRTASDPAVEWDFVIIGGGATGLGTAVEAATRGHRVVLLERGDFAQGTSSRSTKLVHGGLRYLRQGNLRLVADSLAERGRLLRNAPHLVRPLQFVLPTSGWCETAFYAVGLKLYDRLSRDDNLGGSRILNSSETLVLVPTLAPEHARGGIAYVDAQFDDARLALALAQTAADWGAIPLNHVAVTALVKSHGRVCGVTARDAETGQVFELRAKVVINAAGVFGDAVRRLDEPTAPPQLAPSQGAHLVLPRRFLPGDTAVIIPRTADGRVLFAIPWRGCVLLGTTDTPVAEVDVEPRPLAAELEFLLAHAARYFTPAPAVSDILSVFAGLRPLVKADQTTARLPRDHALLVSSSGLVSISGGKWTTYRKMGEDTVNTAERVAKLPPRPSRTATLPLHGAGAATNATAADSCYGIDAPAMADLLRVHPEWDRPLHPRMAVRPLEIIWAARHEMARTVEDVLSRRTRMLILDARASMEIAPHVAALLARELGRDEQWAREQVTAFCGLARGYLP